MNRMTRTLIAASATLLGSLATITAYAADPLAHDHEHRNAAAAAQIEAPATAMQHMQKMHERMMAAKTPAERTALMAEHSQAMKEGMSAMQRMGTGQAKGGMSQDAMHQHMEMMTTMMQMMMDRQDACGGTMSGTPGAAPEHAHQPAPSATPPKP